MKRSTQEYKEHFDKLVNQHIPIVLFLDKQIDWVFPEHIKVYPISLEDCWVSKYVPERVQLPATRNESDTREYMMIQNSKPEFLYKASQLNPFETDWFAWIDFGIVHVFKHPEETLNRLFKLQPPSIAGIHTAGIWKHRVTGYNHHVCWRFAGGFLLIHKYYIYPFWSKCQQQILTNLPYFSWEVNIWADIEQTFPLGWFPADHDDSIIPISF